MERSLMNHQDFYLSIDSLDPLARGLLSGIRNIGKDVESFPEFWL
jgi:hypothetical protein